MEKVKREDIKQDYDLEETFSEYLLTNTEAAIMS
jgi:hypothetical protein